MKPACSARSCFYSCQEHHPRTGASTVFAWKSSSSFLFSLITPSHSGLFARCQGEARQGGAAAAAAGAHGGDEDDALLLPLVVVHGAHAHRAQAALAKQQPDLLYLCARRRTHSHAGHPQPAPAAVLVLYLHKAVTREFRKICSCIECSALFQRHSGSSSTGSFARTPATCWRHYPCGAAEVSCLLHL